MSSYLPVVLLLLAVAAAAAWGALRFYTSYASFKKVHQGRVAVIDAAAVDGRRHLILIRRDNVEHLLMIGGRSDVVIEANIVCAAAPAREAPPPARPQRVPPSEESASWPAEPALPASPPRRQPRPADPLAGLAAELGRVREPRIPMPGDLGAAGPREPREPPRQRDKARNAREMTAEREPMRLRENAREREAEREPVREREAAREREPGREPPPTREPQPPTVAADAPFDADADQNLADMAQRLEAALRRPGRPAEPRPAATNAESAPPSPARGPAPDEASPARVDAKPVRSLHDSLEKELADLWGRPAESASRVKVRHADLGQHPPAAAAPPAPDE